MAVTTSVAKLCEAVLGVVQAGVPSIGEACYEVYDEASFRTPMRLGVSLWVHRLALDSVVRSGQVRSRSEAGRAVEIGMLLTAWAPTPVQRLDLLGWTLSALDRTSVLELASGARGQLAIQALGNEEMANLGARVIGGGGGAVLPTSVGCICRGTVE